MKNVHKDETVSAAMAILEPFWQSDLDLLKDMVKVQVEKAFVVGERCGLWRAMELINKGWHP